MNLVELRGVSKIYSTAEVETHALSGIDFSIADGEYVCIVGPSGSGKSTLLSILGLLDVPSRGDCYFGGRPVRSLSLTDRARVRNQQIGFVFQSFNLIGDLTVARNVELPLLYAGVSSRERARRTAEALERVSIAHRANHYPSQLSGGEQQRAAIARATIRQSSLLLADEPTGNLDSDNGKLVMELLDELNRSGTAVCLVTHDEQHARRARRQVRLFDGRLEPISPAEASRKEAQ